MESTHDDTGVQEDKGQKNSKEAVGHMGTDGASGVEDPLSIASYEAYQKRRYEIWKQIQVLEAKKQEISSKLPNITEEERREYNRLAGGVILLKQKYGKFN